MGVSIGTRLGPYEILAQLGAGGMGQVYLGQDSKLHRKVAIKLLSSEFACNQDRLRRFIREAEAAAALNHPNVTHIYEVNEVDGLNFITMEYVEGETLRQLIAHGKLKMREALDIATQVASALSAAHRAGVVHRDIKPENIMLRPDGYVKVLDFGLAKLTERQVTIVDTQAVTLAKVDTDPGTVMGTVNFMSPEQVRGQEVDARSDLFCFGAVLYEMVTSRAAFEGQTYSDVIAAILNSEPPPLARYSRDAPETLEWIVTKSLRKDREERYQTAKELLTDLRGLKQRLDFQDEAERSTAYSFTGSKPLDSIAVLPFVNVTADPNTEYLSDGISESLINALSRLPKLRVIPRSLVFRYKGKDVDPQAIGRELGVRAVLTGRVIQRGDSLNIQTELIDVANVSQLWGEQYNRKFADILDVQEEITRQLSEKLRIKLTGEERKGLTKRHTENTEAYQLYLKGDYYFNKNTPQGCDKAIEYLQQAIEKDPRYALAYSRLATSYGMLNVLSTLGTVPPKELYSSAKAAAAKALELDDTLADAHVAAAWIKFYYDWDFVDAEREFRRSIQLDPDYALAHHVYAWYLLAMGRQDEAFAEIKRAQELDPTSIWVASSVGGIFFHLRQYDRAIEELRKAIEMDPHFALTHIYLAEVYRLKGMNEEALIEYHKAATLYGVSPGIVAARKEAYTRFGWKGFWQKQLDMNKEQANASYVRAWYLAVPYGYLGDKDQAFNWLQKAYEERDSFLVFLNTGLPQLDNLRSDPRFAELMRKISFTL